jgi:hypothetical protein
MLGHLTIFVLILCGATIGISAQTQILPSNFTDGEYVIFSHSTESDAIRFPSIYTIWIGASGKVIFEQSTSATTAEKQEYFISQESAESLLKELDAADFFSLLPEYRFQRDRDGHSFRISHLEALTVTFSRQGKIKRVYDYLGAPKKLRNLERKIFDASRIAQFLPSNYLLPHTKP